MYFCQLTAVYPITIHYGKHYKITVNYDKDDETEIVIRILSFGPMIKVVAPAHFENLIKERLIKQKSCGL